MNPQTFQHLRALRKHNTRLHLGEFDTSQEHVVYKIATLRMLGVESLRRFYNIPHTSILEYTDEEYMLLTLSSSIRTEDVVEHTLDDLYHEFVESDHALIGPALHGVLEIHS